jgi:hypothetical protein
MAGYTPKGYITDSAWTDIYNKVRQFGGGVVEGGGQAISTVFGKKVALGDQAETEKRLKGFKKGHYQQSLLSMLGGESGVDNASASEVIGARRKYRRKMGKFYRDVEAGKIDNPEEAEEKLKLFGMEKLGIDEESLDRELDEERASLQGRQEEKEKSDADYEAWYAEHDKVSGLGKTRKLHSRRSELRKAEMLRKKGFTRAAERVAANWADSPESNAPAISTPAFRRQSEIEQQRVGEAREVNRKLGLRMMQQAEQKLRKKLNR